MLAGKLKEAVSSGFIEHVDSMLIEVDCTPAVRAVIIDYAHSKIAAVTELTEALGDPEDESELYRSAAFLWLEVKSEWVRFNQTMQYQVARRGEAEMTVFIKGAVASQVLSRIEPLLLPNDVEVLTTMSAEPLQFGKPDVEQIKRFLSHQDDLMRSIGRIFRSASSLSTGIVSLKAGGDFPSLAPAFSSGLETLANRYATFFDKLLQETQEALLVPRELLWPAYASAIEAGASQLGWRVDVQDQSVPGTRIDLRLARVAEELVAAAAMATLGRSAPCGDSHSVISLTVENLASATRIVVASNRGGAPSGDSMDAEVRRDLLAKAERAEASIVATTMDGDQTTVVLEFPKARLSGVESFLVIPGAVLPCCIPASRVEVLDRLEAVGGETWLDLRAPGAPLRALLLVHTQERGDLILACSSRPKQIRGLTLPAASAGELQADCFDFAVISSDGVYGVLGARALGELKPVATTAQAA